MTTVNLVIVALVSFWIIYIFWVSKCYNIWKGNNNHESRIIEELKSRIDEFCNNSNFNGIGKHIKIDTVKYYYQIVITRNDYKEITNIDIKLKRE